MNRCLVILEVSRKQAYIFSPKKLRDNAERSAEIEYVTSPMFFRTVCPELYDEKNMVYSGGGHTIVQFDTEETAVSFVRAVTEAALRQYPDMELFAVCRSYRDELSPGDNLTMLAKALEEKKALRLHSLRQVSIGVEQIDPTPGRPRSITGGGGVSVEKAFTVEGWRQSDSLVEIAGDDGFIAVVHIDGNSMGKRSQALYGQTGNDWDVCCRLCDQFSRGITAAYDEAFAKTVRALVTRSSAAERSSRVLPIRKIISAGDDVCFITPGRLGLEAAAVFLHALSREINPADGQSYSACAGIVIVHRKYPFHRAYNISESLCGSAKSYCHELEQQGYENISAMDWHIEYGQLADNLGTIRADYTCTDGAELSLRPLTVVGEGPAAARCYSPYFRNLVSELTGSGLPRSKIKALRPMLKNGRIWTEFQISNSEITGIGDHIYSALTNGELSLTIDGEKKEIFQPFDETDRGQPISKVRCMLFDAIEMLDEMELLSEGDGVDDFASEI